MKNNSKKQMELESADRERRERKVSREKTQKQATVTMINLTLYAKRRTTFIEILISTLPPCTYSMYILIYRMYQ